MNLEINPMQVFLNLQTESEIFKSGQDKNRRDNSAGAEPVGEANVRHVLMLNDRLPTLTSQMLEQNAKQFLNEMQPAISYILLASSGSTVADWRFQKLVAIPFQSFFHHGLMIKEKLELNPQDTWLRVLPRFHVGGLAIEARQWVSQINVVNLPIWQEDAVKNIFSRESIQYVSLVPTQIYDLIQWNVEAPKSHKAIICGGGFLASPLREQAKKLGWKVLFSYGMTETASMISLSENDNLKPLPGVKLQVNERGILGIFSRTLADYQISFEKNNPDKLCITALKDRQGIFWTQDRVEKQDQIEKQESNQSAGGTTWRLLGRESDYVKIGGEGTDLVALREIWVQSLLKSQLNNFFDKTYLFAKFDERLGHIIVLAIEGPIQELEKQKLQTAVKLFAENVLPNQKIRNLYVIDQIPKTPLGKIKEEALRLKLKDTLVWGGLNEKA